MPPPLVPFFPSLAPFPPSAAALGALFLLSSVSPAWAQAHTIHVNDVLKGVKNFSSASLNRKLRKLREKKILSFVSSPTDERVRFIRKGLNYSDYLDEIDFIAPNNHAQLR